MDELNDEIYNQIIQLSEEGNVFFEKEEFNNSIKKYEEALRLLPSPKYEWDSFAWLMNNIGLSYIELKEWGLAFGFFKNSLLTIQGMEDALIWFYAGQSLFEQNLTDKSKDYFLRAYIMDMEIYEGVNFKYKELIIQDLEILNNI